MNIPPNEKYSVYVNLQKNLDFKFRLFFTLDKEPAIPVEAEAVTKSRKISNWVTNNLDNCNCKNKLLDIDIFTVYHLLSRLNSDSVKLISCLSQINDVGLLYFEKYLKCPEKKNLICILLCGKVNFQGYIVNIKEHKIIHFNSLR